MELVRAKRIMAADFRKNARTLYDEVRRNKKLWNGPVGKGECYVFVSHSGNQILFVLGVHSVASRKNTRFEVEREVLDYRCWRIESGTFDPRMLEDYANRVGLSLGLKTFAQQWADRYA